MFLPGHGVVTLVSPDLCVGLSVYDDHSYGLMSSVYSALGEAVCLVVCQLHLVAGFTVPLQRKCLLP